MNYLFFFFFFFIFLLYITYAFNMYSDIYYNTVDASNTVRLGNGSSLQVVSYWKSTFLRY